MRRRAHRRRCMPRPMAHPTSFVVDGSGRERVLAAAAHSRVDIPQQLPPTVGAALHGAISWRSSQVFPAPPHCRAASLILFHGTLRRWVIARLVLLHVRNTARPEAVRCACCVLLFLAMGAVAHPSANRNALEFFRAMVEGERGGDGDVMGMVLWRRGGCVDGDLVLSQCSTAISSKCCVSNCF
jgi:hypothetical protein